MNKIKKLYLYVLILTLSFACRNKTENKITVPESKEEITKPLNLQSEYYLENRISDCTEKIKFMQSIVEPMPKENYLFKEGKDKIARKIRYRVVGDNNEKKLDDLHKFYFDLNCFEGEHYSTLLQILLSPEEYQQLHQLLSTTTEDNFIFEVYIHKIYSFSFRIKQKETRQLFWSERKINP